MNIKRIAKHLLLSHWQLKRAFSKGTLLTIDQAIKSSETTHTGEIRFVVEGALDGAQLFHEQTAKERAIDVFSHLRIWDTGQNNGVLIYLLLADRDVEIVADRGINSKVNSGDWESICRTMEAAFGQEDYEGGVVSGIQAVTRHLMAHFPVSGARQNALNEVCDINELPDMPLVL